MEIFFPLPLYQEGTFPYTFSFALNHNKTLTKTRKNSLASASEDCRISLLAISEALYYGHWPYLLSMLPFKKEFKRKLEWTQVFRAAQGGTTQSYVPQKTTKLPMYMKLCPHAKLQQTAFLLYFIWQSHCEASACICITGNFWCWGDKRV